jgi:hypothetical protein
MSTHSLLVPQAQHAALFQQVMGMRSPAPQPVVSGNTATKGAFTAKQQLSIQSIVVSFCNLFLVVSSIAQALGHRAPAPQPQALSFVPRPTKWRANWTFQPGYVLNE